jgi:hypothetical protein
MDMISDYAMFTPFYGTGEDKEPVPFVSVDYTDDFRLTIKTPCCGVLNLNLKVFGRGSMQYLGPPKLVAKSFAELRKLILGVLNKNAHWRMRFIDHRPSTIDHRPSTIDHRPSTI